MGFLPVHTPKLSSSLSSSHVDHPLLWPWWMWSYPIYIRPGCCCYRIHLPNSSLQSHLPLFLNLSTGFPFSSASNISCLFLLPKPFAAYCHPIHHYQYQLIFLSCLKLTQEAVWGKDHLFFVCSVFMKCLLKLVLTPWLVLVFTYTGLDLSDLYRLRIWHP